MESKCIPISGSTSSKSSLPAARLRGSNCPVGFASMTVCQVCYDSCQGYLLCLAVSAKRR